MTLLTPRFVTFVGALRKRCIGVRDVLLVTRPTGLAVASRPIGTGQAGIGKAHECPEHDDDKREQRGKRGDSQQPGARC